jgi:hypothetical protein
LYKRGCAINIRFSTSSEKATAGVEKIVGGLSRLARNALAASILDWGF